MKNYLFHTFVFFPLSVLSSICSYMVYYELAVDYPQKRPSAELFEIVVVVGLIIACVLLFWFIDCKIRCIRSGEVMFINLILTLFRFPLQLIGGIFAFIGIFTDKICAYRKVEFDEGFFAGVTSLLFNFYFDTGYSIRHPKKENNYASSYNQEDDEYEEDTRKKALFTDLELENALSDMIWRFSSKGYGSKLDLYVDEMNLKLYGPGLLSNRIEISGIVYLIGNKNTLEANKYYYDSNKINNFVSKILNDLRSAVNKCLSDLRKKYCNFDKDYSLKIDLTPKLKFQ